MGLYNTIQEKVKGALNTTLSDAYKDFDLIRALSTGTYDPTTGAITEATESKPCKGVILSEITGEILDAPEKKENLKILIMDSDKPFDIEEGQKVTYNFNDYRIVGIMTDPIKSSWTISCIAWN